MHFPKYFRHGLATALTGLSLSSPGIAAAQQAYARVLQATPIYQQVAVPHENCREFLQQVRCETSTVYEQQIAGYQVLYEYNGQQYSQRMAHNPGQRVAVQPHNSGSYSSNSANTAPNAVTPGQQSYSSTPPGAPAIDSIQYLPNDSDIPVNVDIHTGRRPYRP